MLCYHGTTADNLQSILENGLICNSNKVWNCSLNEIYCWSKNYLNALRNNYGNDDLDIETNIEDWHNNFLEQAFNSASVSLGNAKDCRAVVVVFDIPESELKEDNSCLYMNEANCVKRNIKPEEIKKIYVSNDLSSLKGYFLCLINEHPLHSYYPTRFEQKLINIFKNAEIFVEDIMDFLEWEEVETLQASY